MRQIVTVKKNYLCNMRFAFSVLLLAIGFSNLYSQSVTYNKLNDVRIDSLMRKSIVTNKLNNGIPGYRVQIHHNQSQNREDSQKFRAKFAKDFPMFKTYLEYKAPYYKIQIGNFITKLEAFKVQREVNQKYRGSYIVPAYIEYE